MNSAWLFHWFSTVCHQTSCYQTLVHQYILPPTQFATQRLWHQTSGNKKHLSHCFYCHQDIFLWFKLPPRHFATPDILPPTFCHAKKNCVWGVCETLMEAKSCKASLVVFVSKTKKSLEIFFFQLQMWSDFGKFYFFSTSTISNCMCLAAP